MDLTLSPHHLELQRRARVLAERLMSYELECEEAGGLTSTRRREIEQHYVEAGFVGLDMPRAEGGCDLTALERLIVREQVGAASNGMWALEPSAANVLRYGTLEQRERYLRPSLRLERKGSYAVSEPDAGSDPSRIRTTATRDGRGWRLRGEKWFVTGGDRSDFLIVHAKAQPGDEHTLFLVDKDLPGVTVKRSPRFMHTFVVGHAEIVLDDVAVGPGAVLGDVGAGFELTKEWFVDARIHIGASTVGAADRCLRIATDFARTRETFGRQLIDHQYIAGMLVDSAVEVAMHRALLYQLAWEMDAGLPPKLMHAKASMVKLACSEMAGRVVDRALQVLGGRGYMRESPVERLYRDLRVDRIWEGTSEIQRVIVANEIAKRGLDGLIELPTFRISDAAQQGAVTAASVRTTSRGAVGHVGTASGRAQTADRDHG